jgi:hypothetical protein
VLNAMDTMKLTCAPALEVLLEFLSRGCDHPSHCLLRSAHAPQELKQSIQTADIQSQQFDTEFVKSLAKLQQVWRRHSPPCVATKGRTGPGVRPVSGAQERVLDSRRGGLFF